MSFRRSRRHRSPLSPAWLLAAALAAPGAFATIQEASDEHQIAATEAVSEVKTEPAAGAVLTRPVRDLRVFLDAPPVVDQCRLELEGPAEGLAVEGLHTMGANDLMARVVGPMPDGEYTARWSATFEDGKTATGEWTFTIRRAAP
jgi:methionine-rich copper-binding protein CopC